MFSGKVVACGVRGLLAVRDSQARGGSADEAALTSLPSMDHVYVVARYDGNLRCWSGGGEPRGARWHVLYGACVLFAAEPGCQARDTPRPCPSTQ
jgi:hypothetical protein